MKPKLMFSFLVIQIAMLSSNGCQGLLFVFDLSGCKNEIDCRKIIDTKFYLHTREDPSLNINMIVSAHDLLALNATSFNASKPTKFIVHGFLDSGDTKWLLEMSDALLHYGDYNVIRVDWRRGSRATYNMATSNTRIVGHDLAYFINTLIEALNLDPAEVHCIGHSLGSHICGYAGNGVSGMGRITALDPLGSLFTATVHFESLDPTDAVFVDVIHTNIENKSSRKRGRNLKPIGNIEIFPNSGSNQPGCSVTNNVINIFTRDVVESARSLVYCSHLRSIDYFIDSLLNPSCQWVAHECSDHASFLQGKCASCGEDNSNCAFLGIKADEYVEKSRINAKFYINTNQDKPFCAQHFVISISTAFPLDTDELSSGRLVIWIVGNFGQFFQEVQIERNEHGTIKNALITSAINVGTIIRVDLEWVALSCLLNPFCKSVIHVYGVKVSPISHYPESERLSYEVTACKATDGSPTPIKHKETESFVSSDGCPPL